MEPKKDYYEVLGVDHDADARTIKRAFLKLARKLHPDVSDAPDAEVEEGSEGAAKEPGVGSKLKEEFEEEVAEHFSSDKWHAPRNPFKGKGKRK